MVISRRWYTRRFWIIWVVTIVVYLMVILKLQRLTALNLDVTGVGCGACPFEFDNHSIFPVSQYVTWSFSVSKEDVPFGILKSGQSSIEKVDWNAYEFYERERNRSGPGEQGRSFTLELSGKEKEFADRLFDEYKYNAYISDHISVERAIEDTRTAACKVQKFIKNIPENSVSVIIVFYNERKSTLLRTVHSVVNRSPAKLLREVILVDDLSVKEELKISLDLYITEHFDKVKIIRNPVRRGLIRSRIAGADASTGTFLVFFDAHIEVNANYLPPLLEPMVIDYRTVTCPMVDTIKTKTLGIAPLKARVRGAFDWDLKYKRLPVQVPMDETTPHPSPVMVGCAFAITRRWWEEFDKYDRRLDIWGGEQYEMSFKSWMCGGRVVDAPCSRVAHLFRSLPYGSDVLNDNRVEFNYLRVAMVWMESYSKYVWRRRRRMRGLDPGDLTKQLMLKKKLNCKSFRWYLNKIAPDVLNTFPAEKPSNIAWGRIRSNSDPSLCLITNESGIVLDKCDTISYLFYAYDWRHHINSMQLCWANPDGLLISWECLEVEDKPTQMFAWNLTSGQIVNFNTHLCVDVDEGTFKAYPNVCDKRKESQKWRFDNYNPKKVQKGWEDYEAHLARNKDLHYTTQKA